MIPAAEVQRVLGLLGGTPRDIANTLAAKGIHGYRNVMEACPVSVYLREQFPEAASVVTTVDWAILNEDGDDVHPLPAPVKAFVSRFDHGLFPELEAEPAS